MSLFEGELVYLHVYDLGGEVRMPEAARSLAGLETVERVEPGKSAPSYVELGRPISLRYAERALDTDKGPTRAFVHARVYGIGALAVSVRVPFSLKSLEEVHEFSMLRMPAGAPMETVAREAFDELSARLAPALVETYEATIDPETYMVVVLTKAGPGAAELFTTEKRLLAGLVAGERQPERLAPEEVEENLSFWYRYYEDDLVIVDWERSLVIEPSGRYDDVLTVMEVANVELLELRAYDRYLDGTLERAYGDLTRFYGRGGLFRSARLVQEDLSNARIDLVRVTDTINNIGKIFGDYYLAKLHLGLTERFHVREWETIVREKMATLNELYTLASHEVEHRRGILLEGMIVLLFIVDLVLLALLSV